MFQSAVVRRLFHLHHYPAIAPLLVPHVLTLRLEHHRLHKSELRQNNGEFIKIFLGQVIFVMFRARAPLSKNAILERMLLAVTLL